MRYVVFFDLFDTLVTERTTPRSTGRLIAEALGLDVAQTEQYWRAIASDRMKGRIPDYSSALREICRLAGHTVLETQIACMTEDRLKEKAGILQHIDLGVIEALDMLRRSGFRIGVISNTTEDEIAGWESCALFGLVETAIFSCRVGQMKPDAEIYHLACSQMGVVPAQCFFVGDGGSSELRGASAVGMSTIRAAWYIDRAGLDDGVSHVVSKVEMLVQVLNHHRQ